MFPRSGNTEFQWQSRSCSLSNRGMKAKSLEESWQSRAKLHGSAKPKFVNTWRTSGGEASNKCEEYMDTRKAGVARAQVRMEQRLRFEELRVSESSDGRSTSESDSDDFDDGALMDRSGQSDQLPQTGSSINRTIMFLWTKPTVAKSLERCPTSSHSVDPVHPHDGPEATEEVGRNVKYYSNTAWCHHIQRRTQ